jgi:hypothetical protein
MFHPNVYNNGELCLDILQNRWSPTYDVAAILTSVQSLLHDPNVNSPANAEAAQLYRDNLKEYVKRVRATVEDSWSVIDPSCLTLFFLFSLLPFLGWTKRRRQNHEPSLGPVPCNLTSFVRPSSPSLSLFPSVALYVCPTSTYSQGSLFFPSSFSLVFVQPLLPPQIAATYGRSVSGDHSPHRPAHYIHPPITTYIPLPLSSTTPTFPSVLLSPFGSFTLILS